MSDKEAITVLTADIGGTNGRLLLWRICLKDGCVTLNNSYIEKTNEKDYRMADFKDHLSLFKQFLKDCGQSQVHACALALCGVIVEDGRLNVPNNIYFPDGTPWPPLRADTIEDGLNLKKGRVIFINDFEAIGYGIALNLDESAFLKDIKAEISNIIITLHEGVTEKGKAVACLGAGTGLGVVHLTSHNNKYYVHPSEGGMANTFSPETELEWKLKESLQNAYGYVEVERIVSGPGLFTLYKFLSERGGYKVNAEIVEAVNAAEVDQRGAVVSAFAQKGDELCLAALDLFLDVYARTTSVMAMNFLPFGGLYLAGGILPKVLWKAKEPKDPTIVQGGRFVERFVSVGGMGVVLRKIPLFVITSDRIGLYGALYRGLDLLDLKELSEENKI